MVCNAFRTSQLVFKKKMSETKQTIRERVGNVSVSYPSLAAGQTTGKSCGGRREKNLFSS